MGVSCVYKITNNLTGGIYIGSTVNFSSRKSSHIYDLRHGTHTVKLQRVFNLVGENRFSFEILEPCKSNELKVREQFYIDLLKPEYNYNALSDSPKGNTHRRGKKTPIYVTLKQSGTNNVRAKLNGDQVKEIREKYKPRVYSSYKLAKEYGVSRQVINSLINKKSYKHEQDC